MKKTITILFFIIFIFVFTFFSQAAEKGQAEITGIVTDTNGVPIEIVKVTAKYSSMGTIFYRLVSPNTWLQTLHPVLTGGGMTPIYDRDICHTKTDNNGFWKITTTRETQDGIKLAYWKESDLNLFSIGVETPDKQNVLIQDITINPNEAEKEINIQLEKESKSSEQNNNQMKILQK